MDVKATSCILFERFCHETGNEAVLARGGLDDPFQEDGVIACQHRVIYVVQIDFKLARRIFGDRSLGRDILCVTPLVDIVEKFLNLV